MILWMVFVFGILYGQICQSHAWKQNLALLSLADCGWIQSRTQGEWKREAAGFCGRREKASSPVSPPRVGGVSDGIIRSICWGWLGWGGQDGWEGTLGTS